MVSKSKDGIGSDDKKVKGVDGKMKIVILWGVVFLGQKGQVNVIRILVKILFVLKILFSFGEFLKLGDCSGYSSFGFLGIFGSCFCILFFLILFIWEFKKVVVVCILFKLLFFVKSCLQIVFVFMLDLKNVKFKIGFIENLKYQLGGGKVQIINKKLDFSNVQFKCGLKDNIKYVLGGGSV